MGDGSKCGCETKAGPCGVLAQLSVRRFINHAGLSRLDVPSPQPGEGSLSFIRHPAIHSFYVCWQDEDQASIVVLPS